jgi:5-methylcytosine-specific restriction protein B
MSDIAEFLQRVHDGHWHEAAERFWDRLLVERYGQRARSLVAIRAPRIPDVDKAPYTAVVHKDSPSSGGYGGTSLVVFPSDKGSFFALVVGTQGLAPDEDIITRPGHARRCRAYTRWINKQAAGSAQAWSKSDPTRIDLPLPEDVRQLLGDWPAATRIYGHVIYLAVRATAASSADIEASFLALLDSALAERGIRPLSRWLSESEQVSSKIMSSVLVSPTLAEALQQLLARRFVVLQGPPGVGKTRMAVQLLDGAFGGRGRSFQFHPSVGYEQFVGGLAPAEANGQFGFRPTPGLLMRAAHEAAACAPEPWLLHLDEVNRADLARVLGEALILFEPARSGDAKRSVELPYDYGLPWGSKLSLPENLFVLGTMNSADRSTAILDLAVRRRFAFMQLWPDADALEGCAPLAKSAFRRLQSLFVEEASEAVLELMPGQAYFLSQTDDEARQRFAYELIPLLKSYVQQGLVPGLTEDIDSYLQWLWSR